MTWRARLQLSPKLAVPLIIALAAFFIWFLSFSPQRIVPFVLAGQVYLIIAVLLAFRYWPPLADWVRAMPIPHRIVFGVLVGAMILGHATVRGPAWYPYTAWCIFPSPVHNDPVTCRQFIGTTTSGKDVRLIIEQYYPSIVQVFPVDSFSPELTDQIAYMLARAYNRKHPADPLRRVDLVTLAVQLHPSATESRPQPSCQLLKRYAISPDRSN